MSVFVHLYSKYIYEVANLFDFERKALATLLTSHLYPQSPTPYQQGIGFHSPDIWRHIVPPEKGCNGGIKGEVLII